MYVFFFFECPSHFLLPTPRGSYISKKLDVKTFLFSSSNRETQRCNGRKSRLSKLLSLVQKQLQKYNSRDIDHVEKHPLKLKKVDHSIAGPTTPSM